MRSPQALPLRPLLARIFHEPSTAAADLCALARRAPSSPLDVVSTTPARSSGPRAAPRRHLGALVTNAHGICGLALLLAVTTPTLAATQVVAGSSESTVNKSITVADGTEVRDVESVNGAIRIGDGASVRNAETVNGSIRFGANARAASAETVNGRIEAGAGFVAEGDLETVNGSIRLGAGARVGGSIESVNGEIELDQAEVGRDLDLVNGSIQTRATRIGGEVRTVNGSVELLSGTIVEGDLIVKRPKGNNWWGGTSRKGPTIVIGANSEVRGSIRVENEYTRLYIDPSARVGRVEGVEAQTRAER